MSRCVRLSLPLILGIFLVSCGKEPSAVSIAITPTDQTLSVIGATVQFKAIVTNSNGHAHPTTTSDVTSQATWASSAPSIASVSASGLATAKGNGTTTISASMGSVVGQATVTVTATIPGPAPTRDLISLAIIPTAQTVSSVTQTGQYIAIGTFSSNPTTEDMTNKVTWSSSSPQVATVNNAGLTTAVGQGTATISAKALSPTGGATIVGTATFTEQSAAPPPRDLLSISIIPAGQLLETTGETAQFLAVGTFSSPPVTAFMASPVVTWKSSAAGVATINPSSGLATAVGLGISTITASAKASNGADILGIATLSEQDGPTPTVPLLTIVKLGAGADNGLVVSNPTPINCGAVCSANFPLGSTVTLTATGATFRAWSSNCAVSGNQCTVTMNVNTVVGAIFD